MKFSQALYEKAKLWLHCKETDITCFNEITEYFDGRITKEAWCAKFMWMVVDLTAKDFGLKNMLPHTASTIIMVSKATNKGLTVNSTPKAGSIFFKTRTGGGHVGLVYDVTVNGIHTIEGNSNDKVELKFHSNYKNYKFIHVQDMPKLQNKIDNGNIIKELPNNFYIAYASLTDEAKIIGGSLLGLLTGGILIKVMNK